MTYSEAEVLVQPLLDELAPLAEFDPLEPRSHECASMLLKLHAAALKLRGKFGNVKEQVVRAESTLRAMKFDRPKACDELRTAMQRIEMALRIHAPKGDEK